MRREPPENCLTFRATCRFAGTILLALISQVALGAEHRVASEESIVDCRTFGGGIQAGDIVTLAGGIRSELTIRNCFGEKGRPITIRNDPMAKEPTRIQGVTDWVFVCDNCENVVIDGTGKWSGAPSGVCGAAGGRDRCGIKVECVGDGVKSWVKIRGSSKSLTIQGIEVDGGYPRCDTAPPGVGISINDHNYELSDHPGEWREGFVIRRNYIHHTASECMYVGPNQNRAGAGDLPLRNNEISDNLVEYCGYDGIEVKSVIAGRSRVHGNVVRYTGRAPGDGSAGNNGYGISLFESGYTEVFGNWIEDTGGEGSGACMAQRILNLSTDTVKEVPVSWYNNVAVNCKGNGIAAGRRDAAVATPVPTIFNNTVVSAGGKGISVGADVPSGSRVENNIVCDSRQSDLALPDNIDGSANSIGSCSSKAFRNLPGRDFRLTNGSPAVDSAAADLVPTVDHVGISRPQGSGPDRGAFELESESVTREPPKPPSFSNAAQ